MYNKKENQKMYKNNKEVEIQMNNYYEPYTYNMYSLQVRKNVNKRKIFVVFSIIIFIITLFVFINFFINKQKAIKCASIYVSARVKLACTS